ncbi:hypothetical protein EIP86_007588 [Pleurotus ostreatoroseus]|nr:hypothetical protein EIP86_007588 [Pleurotus ostreatoroseus]
MLSLTQCSSAHWISPGARFTLARRSLDQHGQWSFLFPTLGIEGVSYSVWHQTYPIDQLRNTFTARIVDMIRDELPKWLNPHSVTPLVIHPRYRMIKDSATFHELRPAFGDLQAESLRLVFSQVINIAEFYARFFKAASPCYATWGEQVACAYPAPDLEILLQEGPLQRTRIDALLAVLRFPGPYDGSVEYMFERTIRPAIRLLFTPYRGIWYVALERAYAMR